MNVPLSSAFIAERTSRWPVELTVVAPCYNERANVSVLVDKLAVVLKDIEWEIIFVDDDSPDGTSNIVRRLAQRDPRVRCLQRLGRRGLSTAVIEGLLASSAPYMAVIDADLQHDEALLPRMLSELRSNGFDIVIGSRYIEGGGVGTWDAQRASISRFATRLAKLVLRQELSDPMSGFFMVKRDTVDQSVRHLSGKGFKILLDLFVSSPERLKFKELPFTFRERQHGESKLDSLVLVEYLQLLLDKLVGHIVPVRFLMFAAVGATGVLVQLIILKLGLRPLGFTVANALATFAAMTSNFAINNVLTYRDRRLRGAKLLRGLLSFYAVCGVGAMANVGIANALFAQHYRWWMAALSGIAVGVVWNYVVSLTYTWKER
jgi:dolichol-phosphate mannosyltransferase